MKLLLTGATGFVGLNLLLRALRSPEIEHLAVCVRHGGKLAALLAREGFCGIPEKISVIEGDARNWNLAKLPFAPEACVHCAGVLFARERAAYFSGNVDGTKNLISALPERTRIIVLSSQSAAGPCQADGVPLTEESPERPLSFYGESKLAMERMLTAGFPDRQFVILRPPTVLGARDTATIPLFRMVQGPVWFKPGIRKKTLSWISVEDLVDAILLVANSGTEQLSEPEQRIFFVSSPRSITDVELVRTTAEIMQCRGFLVPIPVTLLRTVSLASKIIPAIGEAVPSLMPDRALELCEDRWLVSPERFANLFSWSARRSLREALSAQHDFLRKTGAIR